MKKENLICVFLALLFLATSLTACKSTQPSSGDVEASNVISEPASASQPEGVLEETQGNAQLKKIIDSFEVVTVYTETASFKAVGDIMGSEKFSMQLYDAFDEVDAELPLNKTHFQFLGFTPEMAHTLQSGYTLIIDVQPKVAGDASFEPFYLDWKKYDLEGDFGFNILYPVDKTLADYELHIKLEQSSSSKPDCGVETKIVDFGPENPEYIKKSGDVYPGDLIEIDGEIFEVRYKGLSSSGNGHSTAEPDLEFLTITVSVGISRFTEFTHIKGDYTSPVDGSGITFQDSPEVPKPEWDRARDLSFDVKSSGNGNSGKIGAELQWKYVKSNAEDEKQKEEDLMDEAYFQRKMNNWASHLEIVYPLSNGDNFVFKSIYNEAEQKSFDETLEALFGKK